MFWCAASDGKVHATVLCDGKAFQVLNVIIEGVAVDMVDVVASRDRPVSVLPFVPMEEAAARFGPVKVRAVMWVRARRIAPVTVPIILDHFRLSGVSRHVTS